MALDKPVGLTQNDVVGVIQRALTELHAYLANTHPTQVDVNMSLAHIDRMQGFFHTLQDMQLQSAGKAANGAVGKEARN